MFGRDMDGFNHCKSLRDTKQTNLCRERNRADRRNEEEQTEEERKKKQIN